MKNDLIAKRLQLALSNAHMNQQELADNSGVGKSSISQYMNGSHAPSSESAEKLANILNVEKLWLMGFDVGMEIVEHDASDEYIKAVKQIEKQDKAAQEMIIEFSKFSEDNKKRLLAYVEYLKNINEE